MKKFTYLIFVAIALLGFSQPVNAQVNGTATAPVVSTLANPIYYYIESAADGTVKTNANGINALGKVVYPSATNNAKMNYGTVPADKNNALWAIIDDNGTIKVVNKGNGWYINNSHSAGTTQAGFEFALVAGTTKQYTLFSDGVASQSRMLAWNSGVIDRWSSSQGANGMQAFYFILPNTDVELAIDNATKLLNTFSAEGTQPGQYSASARATLQSAIDVAIGVRDNSASSPTDKDNAAATLSAAIDTYRSSRVALATDGSKWYFVKGQRGSTATALYAESQNVGNQVLNKDQTYTNAQAWKIVANGATGYALVNKKETAYLNTDINAVGNLTTVAATPAKAIFFYNRGQNATSLDYFHIENKIPEPSTITNSSTINFRLHAGAAGNNYGLVNYTGGMYDNTKYQFIEAPVTADPTNNPAGGDVGGGSTITVTSSTTGATIYYTLDGTEPTTESTTFVASGGTITTPSTAFTLKTLAVAANYFPSDIVTSSYTITATGLNNAAKQNYVIRLNESVITVDGVQNFEVYSISGQKQNINSPLKAGAYILKIENFVQKVLIK